MENNNNVPDKKDLCPHDLSFAEYYSDYVKAGLWPVRTVLKPRGDGSSEIVPYNAFTARYNIFKGPAPQDVLDAKVNGKLGVDGISLVLHDGLFAVEFDSMKAWNEYTETIKRRLVGAQIFFIWYVVIVFHG